MATEWAYRQVFISNAERAAALAPWLEHYHTWQAPQRPRRTTAHQPPVTNLMAEYS